MKNLFKVVCIIVMFTGNLIFANTGTFNVVKNDNPIVLPSFTKNQTSLNTSFFGYGCKTFHVKVSVKFIEIETDVTVCAGCPGFGGPCGVKVSKTTNLNNEEDLSFGAMDLAKVLSDKRFEDAKEVEILESSSETNDNITLTVKKGVYRIIKDENGSGAIVNLERVK